MQTQTQTCMINTCISWHK